MDTCIEDQVSCSLLFFINPPIPCGIKGFKWTLLLSGQVHTNYSYGLRHLIQQSPTWISLITIIAYDFKTQLAIVALKAAVEI